MKVAIVTAPTHPRLQQGIADFIAWAESTPRRKRVIPEVEPPCYKIIDIKPMPLSTGTRKFAVLITYE